MPGLPYRAQQKARPRPALMCVCSVWDDGSHSVGVGADSGCKAPAVDLTLPGPVGGHPDAAGNEVPGSVPAMIVSAYARTVPDTVKSVPQPDAMFTYLVESPVRTLH